MTPAKTGAKMPKFVRPTPEVLDLFSKITAEISGVELRKMFGYPCAFVNGNMLCGVFADRIMLRLDNESRAKFLTIPGAALFEPFPGRPMREYVEYPKELMQDTQKMIAWLKIGSAYVSSLPPKEKKPKMR